MRRQPAGVPVGGQFAASARPESEAPMRDASRVTRELADQVRAMGSGRISDRDGLDSYYGESPLVVSALTDSDLRRLGPSLGTPIARVFTEGASGESNLDAAVYVDAEGLVRASIVQTITQDTDDGPREYTERSKGSYGSTDSLRRVVDGISMTDVEGFDARSESWAASQRKPAAPSRSLMDLVDEAARYEESGHDTQFYGDHEISVEGLTDEDLAHFVLRLDDEPGFHPGDGKLPIARVFTPREKHEPVLDAYVCADRDGTVWAFVEQSITTSGESGRKDTYTVHSRQRWPRPAGLSGIVSDIAGGADASQFRSDARDELFEQYDRQCDEDQEIA